MERLNLRFLKCMYRSQCVNCGGLMMKIRCKRHPFARANYKYSLIDYNVSNFGQSINEFFFNIVLTYNFSVTCDVNNDCKRAVCECGEIYKHNTSKHYQQMLSVAEPWIELWVGSALQSMQTAHTADNL